MHRPRSRRPADRTRSIWPAVAEPLESRLLLDALPTACDQYLLELINRARAEPLAEAARYGIELNEGVPAAQAISPEPKQPLAFNVQLVEAAQQHTQWMLEADTFDHAGAGGSSPHSRMEAAGYVFQAPWASGENIAIRMSTPTVPQETAATAGLHEDLFVDEGYPGRGHRVNLLRDDFREIGVGVLSGVFTQFVAGQGDVDYNAVCATTDFACTAGGAFLTGVAYRDDVLDDDFYTPGEGLGGVTVRATRAGDGATFQSTTWPSGGYTLALPAGTYEVIATGGALGGTVRYDAVAIGPGNVNRDFTPDLAVPAGPDLAALELTGAAGTYHPGEAIGPQVRVRNLGGQAVTAAFQYEGRISTDHVWGNADDIVFCTQASAADLAAGADLWVALAGTLPADAPEGAYYAAVMIDSTDAVAGEADEANNLIWTPGADVVVGSDDPQANVVTIGDGHAASLRFTDADGTAVTVSLRGGGTAEVDLAGSVASVADGRTAVVEGTGLAVAAIALTGTSSRSALSFSCRGGAVPGATLGALTADGDIGRIAGKDIDLTGDLRVQGLLKTLQLDEVLAAAVEIDAGGGAVAPRDKVAMTFGLVSDASIDAHGLPIGSLTALEWRDTDAAADVIAAPWIGRLTTKGRRANARLGLDALAGDFQAGLELTGTGAPRGVALGAARIAGGIADAAWTVTGDAGSVSVRGAVDGWTAAMHSLRSLTAGDIRDATVTVQDALGSVRAYRWAAGRLDADSVRSLSITGLRGSVRLGIPAVPGDFGADLVVRGQNVARGPALGSAKIAAGLGAAGGSVVVHGDAGSISAGTLAGPVRITGSARSIRVRDDPLALVPALGGGDGMLQVDGAAAVTAGRTRLKVAALRLYVNDAYRSEADLWSYDRRDAWWRYHTTYREGRHRGTDVTTLTVRDRGGTAYDLESDSLDTYAADEVHHLRTGEEGEVRLLGFRWDYSPQEYLQLQFDSGLAILPELVRVGQTYAATDHFAGTFAAEDDGELYEGTCQGTATSVIKLLAYEQVTVPVGTFLAVKAEMTFTIKNAAIAVDDHGVLRPGSGSVTSKTTWWLVPGVGVVKSTVAHWLSLRASGAGTWTFSETVTQELTDHYLLP